jgi:hypothetical protein
MPKFELVARRDDVEQREYPIGYRFRPTRDGVVWVVQDVERTDDTVRHVCRLESDPGEATST